MYSTSSTYGGTYSNDWDSFTRALGTLTPPLKRLVRAEASTAGTLAVILSGQRHYVRTYSTSDATTRTHRAQLAAAEIARLNTRNPDATRYRVDREALTTLGKPRLRRRSAEQKAASKKAARAFWRNTEVDMRRRTRIAAEAAEGPQLWSVMNPGEQATTEADMEAWEQLRLDVRRLCGVDDTPRIRLALDPSGMTPERAIQIAVDVLMRRELTPDRAQLVR